MAGAADAGCAAAPAPHAAHPATAARPLQPLVLAGTAVLQRWPRWPAARIGAALAAAASAAHLALWGPQAPWGRAEAAGLPLALGGLAWLLWAGATLRAAGTPTGLTATPLVLVDEGPYRFGRHPMYLGTVALLTGAALVLGAPLLALAAAGFATIVAAVHVPYEEARLQARFGGWYRDYAGTVRRWF